MTTTQLANLKRIAESVPDVPLQIAKSRNGVTRYDDKLDINVKVIEYCSREWAEFFATFDRPTVLALIEAANGKAA